MDDGNPDVDRPWPQPYGLQRGQEGRFEDRRDSRRGEVENHRMAAGPIPNHPPAPLELFAERQTLPFAPRTALRQA